LRDGEGGSVNGASLSEEAALWEPGGGGEKAFTGDPGGNVKKVSGCKHLSPWGRFPAKGQLVCGGLVYRGL